MIDKLEIDKRSNEGKQILAGFQRVARLSSLPNKHGLLISWEKIMSKEFRNKGMKGQKMYFLFFL